MAGIILPWPPKGLHPNDRVHFMAKSRATKKARSWAFAATREAKAVAPEDGRIAVEITFHPSNNRARDKDGLLSSAEAYLDGISDALDVNDSRFDPVPVIGVKVDGGRVVVRIG